MTIKVVINTEYGGFALSKEAVELLAEKGVTSAQNALREEKEHPSLYGFFFSPSKEELPRHDTRLVEVVEKLKEQANGHVAFLEVVQLKGNKYIISVYDGWEEVQEPNDIEWIVVE